MPSEITFISPPDIPSEITFISPPTIPSEITFGPAPSLTVDWGTPPSLNCTVTVACPSSGPAFNYRSMDGINDLDDPSLSVEINDIGIPSIIKVIAPVIPDIKILHDIPALIRIESFKIPDKITLVSDFDIPKEIKITSDNIISEIKLVAENLPSTIKLESDLPKFIRLDIPEDFPRSIKIDASGIPDKIQVVGIPPSIEIVGNIPSEIKLVMPEKPEIELVYKGSPIDVKIQLDISKLNGENNSKQQCVAIVPCGD